MPMRRSLTPVTCLALMAACLLILPGCADSPQACMEESQAGGSDAGRSDPESEWPDIGPVEPDLTGSPAGAAPEQPQPGPDLADWPDSVDWPESPSEGRDLSPGPSDVGAATSPHLPPVAIRSIPLDGASEAPCLAPMAPNLVPNRPISPYPAAPVTTSVGPTLVGPQNLPGTSQPIMAPRQPKALGSSHRLATSPKPTMARPSRREVGAPAAIAKGSDPGLPQPDIGPLQPEPRLSQPATRASEPEPIADRADMGVPTTGTEVGGTSEETASSVSTPDVPGASEPGYVEPGYEVVKVFYGTDRKPSEVSSAAETKRSGYLGWLYLTALCAGVSAILMLAAARFNGRSTLLVFAGAGVAATVVLGVVTALVRLQGEPVGPRPDRTYGNERGELEMGICEVSIPERHEVGAVERPSVFRLELQEDPRRHVVVLGIEEQPADEFFAGLRDRVDASRKKEAFVFVHGFNTTFEEAAHRTAQLAYDLRFDGAPIFFSWPSQGELIQYSVDETNADWTVPHLKEFLVAVAKRSGAESVHLIAHSMGNRALTSALRRISYEMRDELPLFNELVLTAPDIDAQVFEHDIVPAILPTAERVTLYASSNDEALKLSKTVHGYRRAGDSGAELLVIPGIDTIDVSTVDTSLIGHLYYGDNATVIADMLDLINRSKPPNLRPWLQSRPLGELMYWVFHADPARLEISQPTPPPIRR